MKIGEAFPSKFIKADDLQGRRIVVTIDRVDMETLGQGQDQERKAVLYFVGKDKGLVLNRINSDTLVDILGSDETEQWHGRRVVLFPDKTSFNGKRVPCIRIASAPTQATSRPAPPPPVEEEVVNDAAEIPDSEIPF